ncbi:hypothetical protein [Terrabacter carboxydivorans]|uniref:Uncharacterized protein n=1 Tax=Terrabacter carboxydivorans TaxID=619730 RepID=A0ABN3LPW2_9MICO
MPSPAPTSTETTAGATPAWQRLVPAVMTVAVLGTAVAVSVASHTPGIDIAKQVAYVVLGVVAPGTIVHRSLRGPRTTWVADLALGAATGLALELAAWAAFTALHLQQALWAWPILTVPLLLVRSTRQRVLARPTPSDSSQSWGPWAGVALGLACMLMVLLVYRGYMVDYPLPPAGAPYYPDLMWHMGLVHEATRSVPLLTPQSVADGTLRYHWFSNAHIAASSMMTGTDVAVVFLRLWILPIVVLVVLLTAVLAHRVSGRPWVGALAGWFVVPTLGYTFWPGLLNASNHLNPLSPSQVFSTALALLLVITLVDLVRAKGRPSPGTVAVAALAALATSGSKSSALPVVLGGVGVAFLAALVLRRNRVLLLAIGAIGAVLAAVAFSFVAGGDAGSGYQLFSALSLFASYREVVTARPNLGTPVLDGLVHTPGVGPVLLVALLLIALLTYGRLLAGFLPFFQRALRTDLAAWLLAGLCLTPFLPFFVIAHNGYSQFYFLFGAIPFGSALWAWSIGELVGDSRARAKAAAATFVVVGVLTALAAVVLPSRVRPVGRPAQAAQLWTFVGQVAVCALVLLAILVTALVLRRRGRDWLMPVAACAVVAPLLVTGSVGLLRLHSKAPTTSNPHLLSQDLAAAWIEDHVPLYDVMATNDHCLSGSGTRCNSREWWISGLGGRRVLLEGWAYLPGAAANKGYDDPALYALNQAAFTRPDASTLGAVKQRGVRWLVADTQAGAVSPALSTLTTKVFSSGSVSVYKLG